jgi:hypothetical protein
MVGTKTMSYGRLHLIVLSGPFEERNRRTFEDEEKSIKDIKNIFLRSLFDYCTTIGGISCCSIVDFWIFWMFSRNSIRKVNILSSPFFE